MNSCLNCGKPVVNKYCNVACFNAVFWKGRKASKEAIAKSLATRKEKAIRHVVNCKTCGAEIEFFTERVTSLKKQKQFCSRSCSNRRPASTAKKKRISAACIASEKVKAANRLNKRKPIVPRVKTPCIHCGKPIVHKIHEERKYHSDCWRSISGGFRQGSSRGKSGWYKGYWCDSSYELAWVIYQLEHGVKFTRNKEGFHYEFNGKSHKFYPDFIVDDKYIEIKNFSSAQLDAKLKWFPHKITVLYKKNLKRELDYVISRYGKNFIDLYDERKDILKESGA